MSSDDSAGVPRTRQEPRKVQTRTSLGRRLGARMSLSVELDESFSGDMRVHLRASQTRVAEHLLNDTQIRSPVE